MLSGALSTRTDWVFLSMTRDEWDEMVATKCISQCVPERLSKQQSELIARLVAAVDLACQLSPSPIEGPAVDRVYLRVLPLV
jgi:hypothetical protein